jgi:hypothetical protein
VIDVVQQMADNVLNAISQAAAIQLGLDIIDKAILTDVNFITAASKMYPELLLDTCTVETATSNASSYIAACFLSILEKNITGYYPYPSCRALNWVTQNGPAHLKKDDPSFELLCSMSLVDENTFIIDKFVDTRAIRASVKYYMNIITSDLFSFISIAR